MRYALRAVLVLAFLGNPAHATLIDRGGGLIYDTDLNLTWLQNAAAAAGSTYDDGFSPTDGRMNWANANAWAASLNYGGVDGWRLPSVLPIDGTSYNFDWSNNGSTDVGTGNTSPNSEMAYMYYVNLGNLGQCVPNGDGSSSSCVLQAGWGLVNTGPFMNLTNEQYSYGLPFWSGSTWAGDCGDYCSWQYLYGGGAQQLNAGLKDFYAWAVHPGDVAAISVPEPSAVWLMCIGLLGLRVLGSHSHPNVRRRVRRDDHQPTSVLFR